MPQQALRALCSSKTLPVVGHTRPGKVCCPSNLANYLARNAYAKIAIPSEPDGRRYPGHGTLFPDGYYKLGSSLRVGTWFCPIRGCRQPRAYMKGLGKHFQVCTLLDSYTPIKYCIDPNLCYYAPSGRMTPPETH